MAEEDKSSKTAAKTTAAAARTTAPAAVVLPTGIAEQPKPTPFFEQVARVETATQLVNAQRHTFGAWARVKGVKPEQIHKAAKEGRFDLATFSGDGPLMTEAEFDEAVGFEYRNSFGVVAPVKIHVPAEQARSGAGAGAELQTDADVPEDPILARKAAEQGRGRV